MFVYVPFVKEGYHCFPEAGTDPRYATGDHYDVSHLAARHFHYYFFKVWVEVRHENRDIEFIQLRRWLESLYKDGHLELDYKSCEMLADDLYEQISQKYPGVEIRIDVSEDNINGAYVEYVPDIDMDKLPDGSEHEIELECADHTYHPDFLDSVVKDMIAEVNSSQDSSYVGNLGQLSLDWSDIVETLQLSKTQPESGIKDTTDSHYIPRRRGSPFWVVRNIELAQQRLRKLEETSPDRSRARLPTQVALNSITGGTVHVAIEQILNVFGNCPNDDGSYSNKTAVLMLDIGLGAGDNAVMLPVSDSVEAVVDWINKTVQ